MSSERNEVWLVHVHFFLSVSMCNMGFCSDASFYTVSTQIIDIFNQLCNFADLQKLHLQYITYTVPDWFVQAFQNAIIALRHSLREIELQNQIQSKKCFCFTYILKF